MSEELKAKIRRLIDEAWNKGNLDVVDELCAANYVRHQPPYADIVGPEGFKKFMADVRATYPDWHITIDELIAEGNTTIMRYTWTGTQAGTSPATGAPGTGKKVKVTGFGLHQWVNGQVIEEVALNDWLTFFQQLDYTPPQPKK